MPSKKRKYNARFPAGRIKKIMQTDEEVGKVAQAVPIIISRTLELFVESLLKKAMQVTLSRNAKTLSPSHVKQCVLAEARFDFLKDLVKNIPDVSAAEEKELMSAENSPNTSRFPEPSATRRVARQDSTSSSSSDVRLLQNRDVTDEVKPPRTETITSVSGNSSISAISSISATSIEAIDLTKKLENRPNFYQETLIEERQGVIKLNPTYATPQPSTSFTPIDNMQRISIMPKQTPIFHIDLSNINNNSKVKTPVTPVINIDFSNSVHPEIKLLETSFNKNIKPRQYTRQKEKIPKETEVPTFPPGAIPSQEIDQVNSGNLQIDEDYDT